MYCEQLDQLLDEHSALTMLLFRQDGRTQGWYRTEEEWERECEKLRSIEQELTRLIAELLEHRRQHGCGEAGRALDVCSPVSLDRGPATETAESAGGSARR